MQLLRKIYCLYAWLMLIILSGCGATRQMSAVKVSAVTPMPTVDQPSPTVKFQPTIYVSSVATASAANPARLIVPGINVNAPIENVGIASDGNLDVPRQNQWSDVGWYKSGPRPGQQGSAVIDGHLDRPGGDPAVFWRLRDLHTGDDVMVVDTQGKTIHFRVTLVAAYAPKDAPLQQIFGDTGGAYLNLITCAGDWIPSERQTALRLVVYTTLA